MNSILITTSCKDGVVTQECTASLLRTAFYLGKKINLEFNMLSGDDISHTKNQSIAYMMEKKFSHIMFVNSDIIFGENAIEQLLLRDKMIVGGIYPKKKLNLGNILRGMSACLEYTIVESKERRVENGLMTVDGLGSGFLLVKREVFEDMINSYSDIKYHVNGSTYFNFFTPATKDNVFYNGDFEFCNKYKSIGGEIWADLQLKLGIVGPYIYHGNYLEK